MVEQIEPQPSGSRNAGTPRRVLMVGGVAGGASCAARLSVTVDLGSVFERVGSGDDDDDDDGSGRQQTIWLVNVLLK